MMIPISEYIKKNKQRIYKDFFDFLAIPSISADSSWDKSTEKACDWVLNFFRERGGDVKKIETEGHPVAFIQKHVSDDLPTVLIYGHYDVQPPDPLELWQSPPFEAEIRDEKIYARGASDDKGQMFMHFVVFDYFFSQNHFPCNLKFMIEGEEEVGSLNLEAVIKTHKELFAADALIVSDTSMISLDTPSITVGTRGICHYEITLETISKDIHSGVYGGIAPNPIHILSKLMASLHNSDGKIMIDGFYDNVCTLSDEEKEHLNNVPVTAENIKKEIGAETLLSETGYTFIEQNTIRPCLDMNGIFGGYTGEGSKTIIPKSATAKFSIRTVAGQQWERINDLVEAYFKENIPEYCSYEFHGGIGSNAFSTESENQALVIAEDAIQKIIGKTPLRTYEGASIPILSSLKEVLKLDPVLFGFALASDSIHSPNENFRIENFETGILSIETFCQLFGERDKKL